MVLLPRLDKFFQVSSLLLEPLFIVLVAVAFWLGRRTRPEQPTEEARIQKERNEHDIQQTTRLMGSGLIGIITKNRDGQIIRANKAWLDIVGYDSLEGLKWTDITPPEYHELELRKIRESLDNGFFWLCA
jgi:PAS domain-containing protein